MDKPLPKPDFLTAPFWNSLREGVFSLPVCKDCGKAHFYPRPDCPHCGSENLEWKPASGRGSVYSFTVVHRAPSPAFKEDVPYVVAIVETAEGPHLMSRITGVAPDAVRVGMPLKVKLETVAEDTVLPLFEAAA